jgi:hypothetical protein
MWATRVDSSFIASKRRIYGSDEVCLRPVAECRRYDITHTVGAHWAARTDVTHIFNKHNTFYVALDSDLEFYHVVSLLQLRFKHFMKDSNY